MSFPRNFLKYPATSKQQLPAQDTAGGHEDQSKLANGQPLPRPAGSEFWECTPDALCLFAASGFASPLNPFLRHASRLLCSSFRTGNTLAHLLQKLTHPLIRADSEIALLAKPLDIPTAAHRQSFPLLLFIPPFPVTGDLTPCCGLCLHVSQATVSSVRENSTPYALSLSPRAKQCNSMKCFLN